MRHIPFVDLKAENHRELGRKLGAALQAEIRLRLETNKKKLYRSLHLPAFPTLSAKAKKFLPAVQSHFPKILDELRGLAEGAGMTLEEIMVLTCEEELLNLRLHKCTSLAVRHGGQILVGHNEDWLPSYRDNGLYIVRAALKTRRFLSLSYVGTLPGSSCGLNSDRFGFTGNSINSKRFRYGVPKNIQLRAMLECPNPSQALRVDLTDSSIPGNSLYAWGNIRIFDVEDHFRHCDIFQSSDFLIHTNHPLRPEDRRKSNTAGESIKRYERAREILTEQKRRDEGVVRRILTDHRSGICGHARTGQDRGYGVTIASAIMNPEAGWMKVAWANPCRHRYQRFDLRPAA